jgi:general secretion pathway protein H
MPAMSARPERGFSLLELLVVLAIIAAISAAFPLALNRFVPARRLDSAARILLADIRLAQARSLAGNQPVALEPEAHGYRIDSQVARSWSASTTLQLRSPDDARELDALRLFPDGSTSGARFVITDGTRQRRILVSPLTGRVRLENVP